jgi:CRP/FNR family transcriptional regulator, cyclic AMP receptor protein
MDQALSIDPRLLGRVPLFKGLPEEDLTALADHMTRRPVQAGEAVFAKGDAGGSMYVVLSGNLRIFVPGAQPQDADVTLSELNPGDFFGEMALLDDEPRLASVAAAASSELAELTRENLLAFLQGSGHAAIVMLAEMSRRLRSTTQMLTHPAARDINQEIDRALTWGERLADKVAQWNGSWIFITVLGGLTGAWILVNGVLHAPFDAYPYEFFNLFLAILVAVQGPLIMMSQNRQAHKDRLRSEIDFRVNLKNEVGIEQVLRELAKIKTELRRAGRDEGGDTKGLGA